MIGNTRLFWGSLIAAAALCASGAHADDLPLPESALRQIQSLVAEKESRSGTQRKVDSQLLYAARMARGQAVAQGIRQLETAASIDARGRLLIDVRAPVSNALNRRIKELGGSVVRTAAAAQSTQAWVPAAHLEALASDESVRFLAIPAEAVTGAGNASPPAVGAAGEAPSPRLRQFRERLQAALAQRARSADKALPLRSQGDRTHRADLVRGSFGVNGAGIRIGVLSDSFNNLTGAAADILSGDLPGPGNPYGFYAPVRLAGSGDLAADGIDEGRAMLQIVHDLAPGAQLYFATAFNSDADFANNIRALRGIATSPGPFGNVSPGCDIIIDDVFYFSESGLHDGQPVPSARNMAIISQAVQDVVADGALYFSSAGNSGNLAQSTSGTWEGDFSATTRPAAIAGTGDALNWRGSAGTDVANRVSISFGTTPVVLHWSDPLNGSNNDYDLFVLNAAQTSVVSSSTNVQSGTQDPYERVNAGNNQRLVVVRRDGAAERFISLSAVDGSLQYATEGQIRGHAGIPAALAVAAVPAAEPIGAAPNPAGPYPDYFNASNVTELFSSDGPRRSFFRANGLAYTPGNLLARTEGGILRAKPDLAAADGVDTTLPRDTGLNPFYGTSAAAPHAGAIAALVRQAAPGASSAEIRNVLALHALDIMGPGNDINSGAGIVQAYPAVRATGVAPQPFLHLGAVSVTTGNLRIDPNDCNALSITLENSGLVASPTLLATLSTSTPGVTVTQGSSAYAAIGPNGSSAANATPFQVSTTGGAVNGTAIQFILTLRDAGGAAWGTFPFALPLGVDLANYQFTPSSGVGIPSGGVLVAGSSEDEAIVTVAAPFTFSVYGHTVATGSPISLSTNGNIQLLGSGSGDDYDNTVLPTASVAGAAPAIFPYWDDLTLEEGGIYTQTLGSAPNRQFWVEWVGRHYQDAPGAATLRFAVVLNEGSNQFQMIYANTGVVSSGGRSATIGIQGVGGSGLFTQYAFAQSAVTPTQQLAASFPVSTPGSGPCTGGCPLITVSPSSLPAGVAGAAYPAQTFTASGGTGPYQLEPIGILPLGLTRSGDSWSGTLTAAGTYAFDMRATDANSCTGASHYQVTVGCPTLTINNAVLPTGALNAMYPSQTFTVSGGSGQYTFLPVGALPEGLVLSASGVLSGSTLRAGSQEVTVQAVDEVSGCATSRTFGFTVPVPAPPAACSNPLYHNGGVVNRTSGGVADAPLSIVAAPLSTFGFLANAAGASPGPYAVADDFIVSDALGWSPTQVTLYAYQTNSTTASTITGANLQLWQGIPGSGGTVVGAQATVAVSSNAFSGIYRVADGAPQSGSRPIMAVTVDWPSTPDWPTALLPGTYWLQWSLTGSLASGPFVPSRILVSGAENARLYSQGATEPWSAAVDGALAVDFPFVVCGGVRPDLLFRNGFD